MNETSEMIWDQASAPLFVNSCTHTKDILMEFQKKMEPLWRKIFAVFCTILFLSLSFLYFLIGYSVLGVIVLLLGLLTYPAMLWRAHSLAKQSVQRTQAIYHQPDRLTASFTESGILVHNANSGGEMSLSYSQIRKLLQTQHLYILMMEQKICVLVNRDGFSVGRPETFVDFIQKKSGKMLEASKFPWLKKLKPVGVLLSVMLLLLSSTILYFSIQDLSTLRSPSDCVDMGVHTFVPYAILPTPVKNTSTGRDGRTNPTKTVYLVQYLAADGTGYRYNEQGGSTRHQAQQLYDQGPKRQRVVLVPADNVFFTIPANRTIEEHLDRTRNVRTALLVLSGSYLFLYGTGWGVWLWKKQKAKHRAV